MLRREFAAVRRVSERWPATVLLKGMEKKLVPPGAPVLVLRKMVVKSTKPPGVKSAPPILNDRGDSLGCVSCGGFAATVTGLTVVRLAFTTRAAWLSPLFDTVCSWPLC